MTGWSYWYDLWYCSMTTLATRNQSIKHANSCSPRKVKQLIDSSNTSSDPTHKTYQSGHCWGQMMVAALELPSPGDWGRKWKDTGGWKVHWTTLPEVTQACRKLLFDTKWSAEDSRNVSKQHFSAQTFATKVDCVLGTNIAFH